MYANHEDGYLAQNAAAPRRKGLALELVRAIAAGLQRWHRARGDRQTIVALASLDAHLLRDIGAARGDLERLVREGRR